MSGLSFNKLTSIIAIANSNFNITREYFHCICFIFYDASENYDFIDELKI